MQALLSASPFLGGVCGQYKVIVDVTLRTVNSWNLLADLLGGTTQHDDL